MNRHEIETQLIDKASTDPAFRQRLLDDPKAALAEMLGVALPPDVNHHCAGGAAPVSTIWSCPRPRLRRRSAPGRFLELALVVADVPCGPLRHYAV